MESGLIMNMICYVTYESNGNLTGAYLQELQEIHQENYIEIDESIFFNWVNYKANEARDGVELLPPVTLDLTEIKLNLTIKIDGRVASIIEKWARFQMGYAKREAAARAYKEAGYTGDATRWVTSFADSAGKTAREAADIIIGQADGMAFALENIEALRMEKYLIIRATTKAIADAEFARINTGIDAIVNSLS